MLTATQTIAVAFDLNFRHAAEIFAGVADTVTQQALNWQLVPLQFGFEKILMRLAESHQLSGAIGTFVSDSWVQSLRQHGVEAVNLFNFSRIESIPSVHIDDEQIGQRAAEHLLAQGANRFAFYGPDSILFTQLRRQGFATALPAPPLDLPRSQLLGSELRKLSREGRPLGILCSSDRLARELILIARQHDLRIGRDLLVVGVDDDRSESIFAGIDISSFSLPVAECGRLAAELLHQRLSGTTSNAPYHISPPTLIPRTSSLAPGRARIAQRAINLLQEHCSDPQLDVEQLAKRVGSSRRVLELAFKEHGHPSPYQLLAQTRLQHAQQLLTTTNLPIMEVGRQSGYPEPHHFSAWFKLRTGQSPKAYRKDSPAPSI